MLGKAEIQSLIDEADLPVIHTQGWIKGEIHRSAVLSADGTYRWSLQRSWDARPTIAWVMLNPSTADAYTDDPTIRRCISFSQAWGYGALTVVNLYALRATDPKALRSHPDPIGSQNDENLAWVAEHCPLIVLAWGNNARQPRIGDACNILHRCYDHGGQLASLGWTKNDHPRHPLYLPTDTQLVPFYGESIGENG